MDIRYSNYLRNNSSYYSLPEEDNKGQIYKVINIPKDYNLITGDHWINILHNNGKHLPMQGWKIHISSDLKNAQMILNKVAELMFEYCVSFKYVANELELMVKNSKYGDRASAGKFITIYPKNVNEFIDLLNILEENLPKSENAPYILNDKRWRNSDIYFRYGGFVDIPYYIDGVRTSGIYTPNGDVIEDKRTPFYTLPFFIEEPQIIKEKNEANENNEEYSHLDKYNIHEAIHFSNGGGVYIAENENNEKVVIKEGRPGAGLDASGRDAYTRIKNEKSILENLKGLNKIVPLIEAFDEWEHTFIVEKYIEGQDLHEWLAKNYPFNKKQGKENYINDCLYIISQIKDVLNTIHSKDIGIGDLQPSNIIIDEHTNITLIDFETASSCADSLHSGLMTLGFSGDLSMNRVQSDWFALLRIAQQLFLPIGPVSDISHNIEKIHENWISNTFGERALKAISNIKEKCASIEARPSKEKFSSFDILQCNDLPTMKEKLQNGIIKDLSENDRLIPGDIRQFIMESGKLNVLTGGFGTSMALKRTGKKVSVIDNWINKQNIEEIKKLENGLLTGKCGIASVLLELKYDKYAKNIIETITDYEKMEDFSLASGLSGIGLFFLDIYIELNNEKYLKKAESIGELILNLFNKDVPPTVFDEDIANKGLICGWSGASLFYSALYNLTRNTRWLDLAEKTLDKELELSFFDDQGAFYLDDSFRIMPYLCGGSAGVLVPIIELSLINNTEKYEKEINGFLINSMTETFYNCGLFRGTSGIISITNLIENYKKNQCKNYTKAAISTLNLHLIETSNYIFTPGDSCYRLSGDIFSGSSGLLLVLDEIINNKVLNWLPLQNTESMFLFSKI